ncbi:UNVERIFIED_CONTAM: hypothetical protein Scaly_2780000 [Sesamum calycinum]|uniref:Reverse transcriptase Ty1/copia-type domain-containing protein n=1 Tax=Sesamum calycinum TaxID=2727403 RepID=A0AAW2IZG6_9LAMI
MPYKIWHDKTMSYKYLRVWGSAAYIHRLLGDKLDSNSSLCRFVGYPKETASEASPQTDAVGSSMLIVPTIDIPVLRRLTRVSQQPERYGFLDLIGQLDNDPKTYGEAMPDIDSGKWIVGMESEIDSMSSNKIWTLVDPPKSVKAVGFKWVYKRKLGANGEVITFKARLGAKAAWYDYEIWQMNVKMTFLNGFVDEEIYMNQPEDSHLLEKNRRSVIFKSLSMVSNKLSKARISVLIRKQSPKTNEELRKMFYIPYVSAIGYNDASFQCDEDDAESQLEFLFKLNSGLVVWKNSKQDTTTDSTRKAEYIAVLEWVLDNVVKPTELTHGKSSYGALVAWSVRLELPGFDNMGLVRALEEPKQSHTYDGCTLGLAKDDDILDVVIIHLL